MSFDRTLPPLLAAANALDDDFDDGVDFESYDAFQSADDNQRWIRAWTGNKTLDGAEYRVFGQDGTGGYAALWLVRDGQPLDEQPVVFFGSEGALAVIARNLREYVWLLAGGYGPAEAAERPEARDADDVKTAFARREAPGEELPALELIALARAEFPDFEDRIMALCQS